MLVLQWWDGAGGDVAGRGRNGGDCKPAVKVPVPG